MSDFETERQRRLQLWQQIAQEQDLTGVPCTQLLGLDIQPQMLGRFCYKLLQPMKLSIMAPM